MSEEDDDYYEKKRILEEILVEEILGLIRDKYKVWWKLLKDKNYIMSPQEEIELLQEFMDFKKSNKCHEVWVPVGYTQYQFSTNETDESFFKNIKTCIEIEKQKRARALEAKHE